MADTPTPPAASRRIALPMPVVIGVGVTIAAGLYLWNRKRKQQAAATPATNAQPPVVLAGSNGGGIPTGLLYALLQNQQSSPQPAGAPAGGTNDLDGRRPAGPAGGPPGAAPGGQVQVPTVTGIPLAAAAGYIEQRGLQPSPALTTWSGGGYRNVVSQSPPGGTMVPAHSTVQLNT